MGRAWMAKSVRVRRARRCRTRIGIRPSCGYHDRLSSPGLRHLGDRVSGSTVLNLAAVSSGLRDRRRNSVPLVRPHRESTPAWAGPKPQVSGRFWHSLAPLNGEIGIEILENAVIRDRVLRLAICNKFRARSPSKERAKSRGSSATALTLNDLHTSNGAPAGQGCAETPLPGYGAWRNGITLESQEP
jgi:hypothetical protein